MKNWLIILCMVFTLGLNAQEKVKIKEADYTNTQVEMADAWRENGKIFVLTGVVLIILLGTLGYLVMIDKKVSRIEKNLNK